MGKISRIISNKSHKAILSAIILLFVLCFFTTGLHTEQGIVPHYLSSPQQDCADMLYYELLQCKEQIDVASYKIPITDFSKMWSKLLDQTPDLFHVNPRYTYWYNTRERYVTKIEPRYIYSADEYHRMRDVYFSKLDEATANINPNWNTAQVALYLHDYLVLHSAYDLTYTYYDPYSILVNGTAVCKGYAQAYIQLMEDVGFECDYISSREMNHAWNRLYIDGKPYNVDTTWDDPTEDRLGRVKHTNFLRSDQALSIDHSYTAAEGYGLCSSTFFDDWFWTDVNTAFIPVGDDFYFIKNGTIWCWTAENTLEKRKTLTSKWYTSKRQNRYWQEINPDGTKNTNYSVMWPAGDLILYNSTYSIKSFNPATNELKTVYKYNGDGCIFGFSYIDNTLTLQVGWHPNQLNQTVTIKNVYVS